MLQVASVEYCLQDYTMVHYTGYKVCDLLNLSRRLNTMIQRSAAPSLKTVCTKYSHRYS